MNAAWKVPLDQFEQELERAGYTPANVAQRVKHMRRFATAAGLAPWDVSPRDIAVWLESVPGNKPTLQGYKTSVRSFYRWAYKTGRIFEDPSATPDERLTRLPIPDAWVPELKAFQRSLRAAGRPETTVGIRISHLRRFARESGLVSPWDAELDDLIDWMSGKKWALEYRRSVRASLRVFYSWALDARRIDYNPAERFPVVKVAQPRPRPAGDSEYAAALAEAPAREALMLRLSAELGLRRGEVCQVHSSDITGDPGQWSLVVHGKGDKDRTLPLHDSLATALRALPQGYAFPGNDRGHLSASYVGKRVSRLLPTGVTMHALRHRFATRAYDVDRDVFTVQRLLGHSSPATTQRYVQVTDSAMRRLVTATTSAMAS
jgi:integrase